MPDPLFILTYGKPGMGKTADLARFAGRALFVVAPGAMRNIPDLWGIPQKSLEAQQLPATTFQDATAQITAARKAGVETIVFDEGTYMVEARVAALKSKMSDTQKMFGMILDETQRFRVAAREAGMNVIVSAHELDPGIRNGVRHEGTAAFPGQSREKLPAMCDMVFRATTDASMPGNFKGVYHTSDPTGNWILKTRIGGFGLPAILPMNLPEILRAEGYTVARRADWPWQEEWVENIAQALQADYNQRGAIFTQAEQRLREAGIHPGAIYWTLSDALARCIIRIARQNVSAAAALLS